MEWKLPAVVCALALLSACSSGGPVKTGPDTYYLTRKSAGGGFVSGDSVKASLLREANSFCDKQGRQIQLISAEAHRGIPFAKIANAEVNFRCVSEASPATR